MQVQLYSIAAPECEHGNNEAQPSCELISVTIFQECQPGLFNFVHAFWEIAPILFQCELAANTQNIGVPVRIGDDASTPRRPGYSAPWMSYQVSDFKYSPLCSLDLFVTFL